MLVHQEQKTRFAYLCSVFRCYARANYTFYVGCRGDVPVCKGHCLDLHTILQRLVSTDEMFERLTSGLEMTAEDAKVYQKNLWQGLIYLQGTQCIFTYFS